MFKLLLKEINHKKKQIGILLCLIIFSSIFLILKHVVTLNYYKKHPINIVYTTDKNYKDYLKVSLNSLVTNKNKDTFYNIYILCVDLTPKQVEIYKQYNSDTVKIEPIFLKLDSIKNIGNYEIEYTVTRADLFKFFMPEIFPKLDKILYIDVDTIIQKDLAKLYYTNLGKKYLGAVTKCYPNIPIPRRIFGFIFYKKIYNYNCGVLLFNLKQWRKDNITEKLIKAKNEDEERVLMTQTAFNEVIDTSKIKRLSPIYNVLTQWNEETFKYCHFRRVFWQHCATIYSSEDLFEQAVIIHFVDKNKPWVTKSKYSLIWDKYK